MNRNASPGFVRILIYVFPALMDMIMAQVLFVTALRLAKMGVSASTVAGAAAIWSVVYMVACPVVGRFVTPANSARMMLASCGTLVLSSTLFILFPGKLAIYLLCALTGIGASLFFTPFQIFMKAVDQGGNKPITYSTGLYTFAWSMGFACGPFVSGFLMEMGTAEAPGLETSGWKYAFAFAGAGALLTAIGILFLKHLVHPAAEPAPTGEAPQPMKAKPMVLDYSGYPDLAWLGWIGAGIGVVVLSVVRAVFPSHAVSDLHLSDSTQGTIFFLLSLAQGITGLALCLSRRWMYRPRPVAVFGLVGIAGALFLGYGPSVPMLYLGGILFGVYSGAFFFYLVFHALAHPVKSAHYVAINESVVGVGGIIGPVAGGLLADRFGFGSACLAGAALLLLVTFFQAVIHHRRPPVL